MDRRAFLGSLAGVFAVPLTPRAQLQDVPRLCFLTFDPGTLQTRSPRFDGFFQGLQDLGYVNGRSITSSYLSADNNGDRFPALIDECLKLKPRVIAVTTTPAAPSSWSRWETLSGPSENITGMSLMVPQLAVKRLELLKELVPGLSRVRVLSVLADPIALIQVKAMEAAAGPLHVALQIHDIRTADDIPTAFAEAHRAHAEGVVVTEESMFAVHRARLTELAAQNRMPAVYPFPLPVTDAGGLMAYTVKASELYRNAACMSTAS
jgi:putative ABC transport system substrate-binding protein